jgi:hypothetical protein
MEPHADEQAGSFIRRRRRSRGEPKYRKLEAERELDRTGREADYRSWDEFYGEYYNRRGTDVRIGVFTDRGLRWTLSWLSRTTEVIAWPISWIDEGSHLWFDPWGYDGGVNLARVPQWVFVLGRVESLDEARAALASASTLDDARATFV